LPGDRLTKCRREQHIQRAEPSVALPCRNKGNDIFATVDGKTLDDRILYALHLTERSASPDFTFYLLLIVSGSGKHMGQ